MQRKEKICFRNFLTGMRTGQNVTLEQLGWGLYSADMLSRIEAGERLPDKMTRDRLMERLGFEDDGFEDYLQPDEYDLWELRDRLVRAVDAGDVPEAERLLQLLEQEDTEEKTELSKIDNSFLTTLSLEKWSYAVISYYCSRVKERIPKTIKNVKKKMVLAALVVLALGNTMSVSAATRANSAAYSGYVTKTADYVTDSLYKTTVNSGTNKVDYVESGRSLCSWINNYLSMRVTDKADYDSAGTYPMAFDKVADVEPEFRSAKYRILTKGCLSTKFYTGFLFGSARKRSVVKEQV